ncbi:MAG: AAC(3) family N-acetyltransferase [Anaerolineae bacterium]|nr:AAC(3) family N-acetyltransferase [Anaerolineae bacterium]MCO5196386.1 AAC(3) family N-acetyltransferase [Anaerolineae bacterium]MCO5204314.1 AAC(3) family N-acetyltransferase [Anaerolineae bacterium]
MNVTKIEIKKGLEDLGVPFGAVVLVHCALSSFGHVEGGAKAVIDALLETVGPRGTIMVPTLTGHENLSEANPPFFDVNNSEPWTGLVPKTFLSYPQAIRSMHPTHSTAAIGPMARYLTSEHMYSSTPCDQISPYGKLGRLDNGYILLLGVTNKSNTTLHHVEELVGVDYHIQPSLVRAIIIDNDRSQTVSLMIHKYGEPRDFDVVDLLLENRNIQVKGIIGESEIRLIKAQEMIGTVSRFLMANKKLLLKNK